MLVVVKCGKQKWIKLKSIEKYQKNRKSKK